MPEVPFLAVVTGEAYTLLAPGILGGSSLNLGRSSLS
jgi:hypothetical protein